jgi:GMP synthase-like glutamine amidotransferase
VVTSCRLLLIQPAENDPPAELGNWLVEAGAELDLIRPADTPLPDELDGYHGVVCLGGGMSATSDGEYPWLAEIRRVLAKAVARQLPTLGVCLGGQLLAMACGGAVAPGDKGPEAGPALVAKRDTAWIDPLFAEMPLMPDVLQFHRDVIARTPANAVLLASSLRYPNQAFRVGRSAYGLQFHIETTTDIVLDWVTNAADIAASARADDLSRERLDQAHTDIADTWRPWAHRFVRLAAGELQPAEPTRPNLPLA